MGEPTEPVRPLADLIGKEVVDLPRPPNRERRVALDLHARTGEGEDAEGNPMRVHLLEPPIAEIGQAADGALEDVRIEVHRRRAEILDEIRRHEVFFERDLSHRSLPPPILLRQVGALKFFR